MHVRRVRITGFKRFQAFDLELSDRFNVLVGQNEAGKSALMEATALVLSGQYEGRLIAYSLDPYMFNASLVADYFAKRAASEEASPPAIQIEAYLGGVDDDPNYARLKGSNNDLGEDCPGLSLRVEVAPEHVDDLKEYAADNSNPTVVPIEFYRTHWRSFAGETLALRRVPFRVARIDASMPRVVRGPNQYLSQLVANVLDESQRRSLGLEYKRLRHKFSQEPGVEAINSFLEEQRRSVTGKKLSVQMDMSSRATWDNSISAHLDDLPFDCAGRGEQCRMQLRLAVAAAEHARVVLIEEPENHLSHANLNGLLEDIRSDSSNQQIIVSTHNAFVLNKLGVDTLRLITGAHRAAQLKDLSKSTRDYFVKLPGHDTLRLILSSRSILVEGPSDELIVQHTYEKRHGRPALADGVDIIAVGSLAFSRFLEVAKMLDLEVTVLTDNDEDVNGLRERYREYLGGSHEKIRILFDDDEAFPTLEPQLLKANGRDVLNSALGTRQETDEALLAPRRPPQTPPLVAGSKSPTLLGDGTGWMRADSLGKLGYVLRSGLVPFFGVGGFECGSGSGFF
jgi:putative ATP-dependent endonuclease of the OLD family